MPASGSAVVAIFCVIARLLLSAADSTDTLPYELNVVPTNLPELTNLPNGDNTKHIPRKIWMAVKDINDELPGHIKAFFQRNPKWEATVCDNDCKDKFMNTTFAGWCL